MEQIKAFLRAKTERFPRLKLFLQRIYHGQLPGSVKKRIIGKNNQIRYPQAVLTGVTFDIRGNHNIILIALGAYLNRVTFYLRGDNHRIVIGAGCRFNRGGLIWFEDQRCGLEIGAGTTLEEVHIAITEPGSKVVIGSDCMLAYDIDIRTGDSHSLLEAATGKRINYAKDVTIGDHVWIASHVIIHKGVSLASDTVVATGTVVTDSQETPGVVLAGNPGKVIKQGITWARDKYLA